MSAAPLSFEEQSLRAKLDSVSKEVAALRQGKALPLSLLLKLRDMVDPALHGGSEHAYEIAGELDQEIARLGGG